MPDQRKYRTIVADPPWHYDVASIYSDPIYRTDEGARGSKPMAYPTMTVEEICAVPVSRLADAQGCHLYLWTTQRYMRQAYEVLDAWGFKYASTLVWCKPPRGFVGTFPCSTEFVLFARRGNLPAKQKGGRNWWEWSRPNDQHSRKPEAFMDIVEQVSPGPYLEMFSRRARLGWDTWGNESLHGGAA